ncbi:ATP-citrate synthase [Trichonephila inaurata madagascariensis]|uniref:ATP citrate synthase n=2 Tax=Trichonephila inaurata madagascariensis TaxID=2747483 RepID=A0A8X6XKT6_9ARAC|nr:ATP-citrate synthase [Trichonephila inaurata madagascariensis]
MSAKAITEATGKSLLSKFLCSSSVVKSQFAVVDENSDWQQVVEENPWLLKEKLVVKPDQLIKRRGKLGLIKVNTDLSGARAWIDERMNKVVKVDRASGRLHNFIIEPFVPHKQDEEAYVCIYSHRYSDTILFHHEGGVDIGDVDAKALRLDVPIDSRPSFDDIKLKLVHNLPSEKQDYVAAFISTLYDVYVDLYFTYLEINPLVLTEGRVYILDLAAKLDATADFVCKQKWGEFEFPPAFGRDAYPEEAYIADLDAKSGASLKLTILNKSGRIWTMVAGGGASVIYSDTICELGGASELANYGEYSGAPTEMQTYEYAKTILSLMTSEKHPEGKILLIGGGIANFTNVAATFKGIVKALVEFQTKLIDHKVSIFVRRAGPNYQEGLRVMREVGGTLGVPIHVFGPETHMTAIVGMAMGKKSLPAMPEPALTTANFLLPGGMMSAPTPSKMARTDSGNGLSSSMEYSRSSSVSSTNGTSGTKPLFSQIKVIAIIAEGIPENMTRKMIQVADGKGITIIGPATVGGIKPGCFKIGNTGGMMDNILASKLHRPGCVAYVSRSGGMSNELNNIISRATNGVYEGVAIGGDRYPGTTFMDHLLRYQQEPDVKMMVLLGEVGGVEEYEVCKALKSGQITKPLVAWCIGTCAKMFTSEVQFGHAGACANSDQETAVSKNKSLSEAGAYVPDSFDNLGKTIQ